MMFGHMLAKTLTCLQWRNQTFSSGGAEGGREFSEGGQTMGEGSKGRGCPFFPSKRGLDAKWCYHCHHFSIGLFSRISWGKTRKPKYFVNSLQSLANKGLFYFELMKQYKVFMNKTSILNTRAYIGAEYRMAGWSAWFHAKSSITHNVTNIDKTLHQLVGESLA